MAPYDAEINFQSQSANSTEETDPLLLYSSYSRLTVHSDDTPPLGSSTNASTSLVFSTRSVGDSVPLIYRDADNILVQHNRPSGTLPASFRLQIDPNYTQKNMDSGMTFNASRYSHTQIANSNTHSSMNSGRPRNIHNSPRFSPTEALLPVHQPHARVSSLANDIVMRTTPVPIHTSQPTPTRSLSLLYSSPVDSTDINSHRNGSSSTGDQTSTGSSEQVCLHRCCLDCDGEGCLVVVDILYSTCALLASLALS